MDLSSFIQEVEIPEGNRINGLKAISVDKRTADSNSLYDVIGCGSFHCCDYILPTSDNKELHLIEESCFCLEKEMLKKRFSSYLKEESSNHFIQERISQDILLKAYGSLVILLKLGCFFEEEFSYQMIDPEKASKEEKQQIYGKNIIFCVVISDSTDEEDVRAFPALENQLKGTLESAIKGIRVMNKDKFIKTYSAE